MQNRTDIINAALQRCGAAGVNLAYQGTQEADIAAAAYDRARKLVLSQYTWGFAQKYVTLAQEESGLPFGYRYAFRLPGDCAVVIDLHAYEVDDDSIRESALMKNVKAEFDIVGRSVMSNEQHMALRYVSDIEMDMPEPFANVVAWRLAFEIAPYLQQGTNQAAFFLQMYQQALDDAKVQNDAEINPEHPDEWRESHIVNAMRTNLEERW